MLTRAALPHFRRIALGAILSATLLAPSIARSAVSAGGIVVIGYTTNNYDNGMYNVPGTDDEIAFVATEFINANEVLYVTNIGWSNDDSALSFFGADPTGATAVGNGQEQMMMLTINSDIYPGTIIRTSDNLNGRISWDRSSTINTGIGPNTQTFSPLDLSHGSLAPGQSWGDQIYIFQADGVGLYGAGVNPLLNPTNFVHTLSMGDETGNPDKGFTNAYGSGLGGASPDGRVSISGSGGAYNTVNTVDVGSTDADPNNDFTAFELDYATEMFDGTFHLNLADPDIAALQLNYGSKADWMAYLGDASNWTSDSNLAFGPYLSISPEPSRALLILGGILPLFSRRRRLLSA